MAKVICTRPNASDNINGVAFAPHERGVISEEISDEQAAAFIDIPGYELDGAPAEHQDNLSVLHARAAELGVEFKGNWGSKRIEAEIKRAEEKSPVKPE